MVCLDEIHDLHVEVWGRQEERCESRDRRWLALVVAGWTHCGLEPLEEAPPTTEEGEGGV